MNINHRDTTVASYKQSLQNADKFSWAEQGVKPATYHLPQPESYAAKDCGMQKYMLPAQAFLRVGRKDWSQRQSLLFKKKPHLR